MIKEKTTISQRLINALLLNGSFIDNPGLLNGKMGLSICFYHLARRTGNSVYEDYAGELIDEIYEEIGVDTPFDFENGLAGIGWGIEYLVQNGFIEADTDEVLEEFDKRLMPLIYSPPATIGLCNGLVGLGAYLLKRIQNPNSNDEKIQTLINKQLLIHLISEMDRRTQDLSSIIREPVSISNRKNLIQESESCVFDLTWDYPALIGFLAEVSQLNLYNTKVNSILQRFIAPLSQTVNLPKLQSNRLLLACSLVKLRRSVIRLDGQPNTENISNSFLYIETENTIQRLLSEMSREIIAQELPPNCAFLKNGTTGVAWIYHHLFCVTANPEFKTEADYWLGKSVYNSHLEVANINEEISMILGILKGYAGLTLFENYHEKN